jgi:hypothetical protein
MVVMVMGVENGEARKSPQHGALCKGHESRPGIDCHDHAIWEAARANFETSRIAAVPLVLRAGDWEAPTGSENDYFHSPLLLYSDIARAIRPARQCS